MCCGHLSLFLCPDTHFYKLPSLAVGLPTSPSPVQRVPLPISGLACASVVYLGYRGLHACGYRFSDLFYVTGRKFHNTVATLAAGMQTLTQKVSGLSHGVRDLKENINCGFERVNTDVNAVQTQVETLQDSVERVESSVDRVEEKVEHTRQGMEALQDFSQGQEAFL